MALDYIAFGFWVLQALFREASVDLISICLCWCCHRLFVVVIIDCVLIFFGDGDGISHADWSLQCRTRVCERVGDLLLVVGAVFVGVVLFSLEVHAFHGVDSVRFVLFFVLFNWLSQRCVGVSYALRVSPAVTRLTVYRRPQVCGKRGVQVMRAPAVNVRSWYDSYGTHLGYQVWLS